MDLTFHCPNCRQEMVVDAAGAGSSVGCPTCEAEVTIPEPDVTNIHMANPIATSAAAKEEKHFSVPVHDAPTEVLVKAKKKEEDPDTGGKTLKIKVFRRSDCVEVGEDFYERDVTKFLTKIGENNIVSMTPISYTHLDLATQKLMVDYGIQIVYRR